MKSESTNLRRIINRGNLSALHHFIQTGSPLRIYHGKRQYKKTALEFAIQTGFYSMVKLLLKEAKWEPDESGKALSEAVWNRRGLRHLNFSGRSVGHRQCGPA